MSRIHFEWNICVVCHLIAENVFEVEMEDEIENKLRKVICDG